MAWAEPPAASGKTEGHDPAEPEPSAETLPSNEGEASAPQTSTPAKGRKRGLLHPRTWPGRARTLWQEGPGGRLLLVAMAAVAAGLLLRVAAAFAMELRYDGSSYAAMGHAFTRHGEFLMPWGEYLVAACNPPAPSHHFPPLYPMYLSAWYVPLGFGLWQTKAAALAVSILALAVVFLCTRERFGTRTGWLVAGLVALEPHLVWATGTGYSESLVLLLFTLTLWAILKSLTQPRFILLAGLAAGLAYLSRAGMGPLFIVAGLGGLGWRFAYQRWAVLRDRWYLGASAIFGALVAAWALRNLAWFGWPHWQSSLYTERAQAVAASDWGLLAEGLAWKLPFFALLLLPWALAFLPELRGAWREARRESESVLWLAVALVAAIGWAMSGIYWTLERYHPWFLDNHRYLLLAELPLLWLALRRLPSSRKAALRYGALAAALALASAALFLLPVEFPENAAARELDGRLGPDTILGIEGSPVLYTFYPYLERQDIEVVRCNGPWSDPCPGQAPDFILSRRAPYQHAGYELVWNGTVRYNDPWGTTVHALGIWPDVPHTAAEEHASLYARTAPSPQGPRAPGCVP